MAITPRTFTDRLGAPNVESLVPRVESTLSHFCNHAFGGVHQDISHGGPGGVPIEGPWRSTVTGQDLVITGDAQRPGVLSIDEGDGSGLVTESLVLGQLGNGEALGARVQITGPQYRVRFTPSGPCDRVLIETQLRP